MIIVTGGAGFIGSAFVWKLNQEGIHDILIVDALEKSESWKNLIGLNFSDYVHKDDFLEMLFTSDAFENVDAVIHMGACSSTTEEDGDYLMDNNYRYTQALCQWSIQNGAYFMYASSAATYGNGEFGFSDTVENIFKLKPTNRYGFSKQFFDMYAMKNGLLDTIVGLKFFNVFGPNEAHKAEMRSVVCKAYEQIKTDKKVKLFKSHLKEYKDGEQKRDFVYIKDCVNIMWWLLSNRSVTGIYNIGTGNARTWNDLVKSIFKAMDIKPSIEYIDMPEHIRKHYQYFTQADMQKLKAAGCPIKMTSLEDAVKDYVQQYLVPNKLLPG